MENESRVIKMRWVGEGPPPDLSKILTTEAEPVQKIYMAFQIDGSNHLSEVIPGPLFPEGTAQDLDTFSFTVNWKHDKDS